MALPLRFMHSYIIGGADHVWITSYTYEHLWCVTDVGLPPSDHAEAVVGNGGHRVALVQRAHSQPDENASHFHQILHAQRATNTNTCWCLRSVVPTYYYRDLCSLLMPTSRWRHKYQPHAFVTAITYTESDV